ncbi:hypothetical protein GCM10009547_36000 [Sporichthya brevicatena]|uniref:LTD domain-containing protein n=1 Tax=Sporichthya brevicatena TaxID=171442 RepID=A0ABP3S943_9ACTN
MFHRTVRVAVITGVAVAALAEVPSAEAASSPVRVSQVYFDPPGNDTKAKASKLNLEKVVIRNTGRKAVSLAGWTLRDTSRTHRFVFPKGFKLAAGATVTVHTGSGKNTAGHLYWRSKDWIWNNDGDRAYLRNAKGTVVHQCAWTKKSASPKFC